MADRFKRYAAALKRRRYFVGSFGPVTLWLLHPRRGLGFSLTLVAAFAVLGAGLLDDAVSERASAGRPAPEAAAVFGEPPPPPLDPFERLGAIGRFAGIAATGAEARVRLESGASGVNQIASCSVGPVAQHERNPDPAAFVTVHTSETLGSAQIVCDYHAKTLGWGHVGYHYQIDQDGTIRQLLPHASRPYAQITENRGIAVVLQGMSGRNVPTDPQRAALATLLRALKAEYPTLTTLLGHRDHTNADQARLRAGTWPYDASLANTHTDPAPGDQWETADPPRWGLAEYLADPAPRPPPSGLGTYRVPDQAVRSMFRGSATYYLPTGRPTASGEPYTGQAHTGAVWLVTRDQLADDDPRVRDCHDSPTLGAVVCPALRFGAVARVCRQDRPAVCTRVAFNDTGMMKSDEVDLSPLAFQELGPLREGRIAVTVTVVGYLRP